LFVIFGRTDIDHSAAKAKSRRLIKSKSRSKRASDVFPPQTGEVAKRPYSIYIFIDTNYNEENASSSATVTSSAAGRPLLKYVSNTP